MHKYKTISSYCFKCTKRIENTNPSISKTSYNKTCYYRNMLYMVDKNQDL